MSLLNLPNPKWDLAGDQKILKEDFKWIEAAIMQSSSGSHAPHIAWIDETAVRVVASTALPTLCVLSGFPSVIHPGYFISASLSDGKQRENTSSEDVDFDLAACLWGTEKASQWYGVYAIAGDADTEFTLKAMPFCRVSSQASQVITLRNNLNAADIGYGFTTDEFVGGDIYVISGASKGLLREITANNNNNTTGGTITYSGAALSLAQGDWFVILPVTNFRWIGDIFNDSSSDLYKFERVGLTVSWLETVSCAAPTTTPTEDIKCGSPLASMLGTFSADGYEATIGHPDGTVQTPISVAQQGAVTLTHPLSSTGDPIEGYPVQTTGAWNIELATATSTYKGTFALVPIANCRYRGAGTTIYSMYWNYPQGYL